MFYLVQISLPFWDIIASNEDENVLDAMIPVCASAHGFIDVIDDEALQSLRAKYPQARTTA